MYGELFDEKKQKEMRNFFLEVSKQGIIRKYHKNEIIDRFSSDFIVIVVEGRLKQIMHSSKGLEKSLFILQPGEILGEMDYFTQTICPLQVKAMENSTVSFIYKDKLEKLLDNDSEGYRFFIHSIIRKFRIVMFQMADMIFNTSTGKIADTLLRLASQQGSEVNGSILINVLLTHQELANLVGCSRITVTKGLNELKNKKIIETQGKKIVIKNIDELKDYTNSF